MLRSEQVLKYTFGSENEENLFVDPVVVSGMGDTLAFISGMGGTGMGDTVVVTRYPSCPADRTRWVSSAAHGCCAPRNLMSFLGTE